MSRRKRWLLGTAGALLAAIGLGFVALVVASAREGVSVRAQFVLVLIRAIDAKHTMASPDAFQAAIAESRKAGEAAPPETVNAKYLVAHEKLDDGEVYTLTPRSGKFDRTVLFIHGGAYCGPMSDVYWDLVGRIGDRTGARFVVPLYPLAPEHDWKPAYSMLAHLYDRLAAEVPASSITIAGDSAGGGLTLGFAEALRDANKPLPARIVLLSPWLNLLEDNPAQQALEGRDSALSRPALVWAAKRWAGGTPLEDPHISPVLGSLEGLPPILLFSGTRDLLNADARELVERARARNVALTYVEAPNMIHDWVVLPIPEAFAAQEKAAGFILGTEP